MLLPQEMWDQQESVRTGNIKHFVKVLILKFSFRFIFT